MEIDYLFYSSEIHVYFRHSLTLELRLIIFYRRSKQREDERVHGHHCVLHCSDLLSHTTTICHYFQLKITNLTFDPIEQDCAPLQLIGTIFYCIGVSHRSKQTRPNTTYIATSYHSCFLQVLAPGSVLQLVKAWSKSCYPLPWIEQCLPFIRPVKPAVCINQAGFYDQQHAFPVSSR